MQAFFRPFRFHKKQQKREIKVTVCVAAIYWGTTVVGASDRMLTSGDIEFEPQQPKIIPLSNSIAVMIAGDSAMQAEIIKDVENEVIERINAEPNNWWKVKDVAELYCKYYNKARLKRVESNILSPLGLDKNSFISRQKEMDSNFISQIVTEMINFALPDIASIFVGIDDSGPHIYLAKDGDISCQDNVGFASIGVGAWHANSQMMFAGHNRRNPLPETLLLVYSAKKRAEVAPGVGQATDMFTIGPTLGSFAPIGDSVLKKLEQIHKEEISRLKQANLRARKSMNEYVEEIAKAAIAKEQAYKR